MINPAVLLSLLLVQAFPAGTKAIPVLKCDTLTNHILLFSTDTLQQPSASLEEVIVNPLSYLMITDTAAGPDEFAGRLGRDYSELNTLINHSHLTAGRIMTFYHTATYPLIFDAAIAVDNFPPKVTGGIRINKLNGGIAIVAHYKGPYDQIGIAYSFIHDWLKTHNKAEVSAPFEVYINSPGVVNNVNDLRTDVYQLFR
ncbi:MAG: GyrI-like domain-containing protein [Chitinophagaceae bacterium]